MELYNLGELTHKLHTSGSNLFTSVELANLFRISAKRTLLSAVNRLSNRGILEKVEKGKYVLAGVMVRDLTLANFLYQPSYVSLETILNLHGILSQVPLEVTSVSPKKTLTKVYRDKVYSYAHIKPKMFFGIEKRDGDLVAIPEKALVDQYYLHIKGLRQFPADEYDLERINRSSLKKFAQQSGVWWELKRELGI